MAGKDVSEAKYGGAQSGTMRLTLFFDTTNDGTAVTVHTDQLLKLLEPNNSLPGSSEKTQNARPPTVTFHWGKFESFKAVITSLELSFKYFSASGTPLRAEASLSLMQFKADGKFGPQNPTSGTPRPHRVHRVQPGETLDRISAIHYGDPTRWRAIADGNNVADPMALRAGSLLSIPDLD
jgi:nucleoid-associated protein YgaU